MYCLGFKRYFCVISALLFLSQLFLPAALCQGINPGSLTGQWTHSANSRHLASNSMVTSTGTAQISGSWKHFSLTATSSSTVDRVTSGVQIITPTALGTASSLIVSKGATVILDLSQNSSFSLPGNLINRGSVYVVSSNPNISTATISAANIFNRQSALLTTVLPSGGLAGILNPGGNLSLSLLTLNNFVNAGTIFSAGNLSVSAGGSITNALPRGVTGPPPALMAANNVQLASPNIVNTGLIAAATQNINLSTSSVLNSGLIQAMAGSIAIQNLIGNTLAINNQAGTIMAKNSLLVSTLGTIYDDHKNILSKASLLVSGGSLAASQIDFTSPDGIVNVQADSITGGVSVSGGTVEVGSNTGGLDIVSMHVTGDPVFYSHDPIAGLVLSGINGATGGDFTALSEGDITTTDSGSPVVDASNAAGTGGKIELAAGVLFNPAGAVGSVACPGGNCGGLFSITGTSLHGGSIILPNVSFQTNGNSISLEAHQGFGSSGSVTVGNLNSSGAGGAAAAGFRNSAPAGQNAGTITVLASGDISTGSVRAFGGGGAGGTSFSENGGTGGKGGAVSLSTVSGIILVDGDINTSGGGGGGSAADSGGFPAKGGNGGDAGTITVSTPGSFVSTGPILAAGGGGGAGDTNVPCCPQIFRNGGGSFGGGGGGGDSGAGGGGFVGGGGSGNGASGGGGGFFGPGAADQGAAAGAATGGGFGQGGTGVDPFSVLVQSGGLFGVSGGNSGFQTTTAQSGLGSNPGSAGQNGAILINAASTAVRGTVQSFFGFGGPFAGQSIFGNITGSGSANITSTGTNGSATPILPVNSANLPSVPNPSPGPGFPSQLTTTGSFDANSGSIFPSGNLPYPTDDQDQSQGGPEVLSFSGGGGGSDGGGGEGGGYGSSDGSYNSDNTVAYNYGGNSPGNGTDGSPDNGTTDVPGDGIGSGTGDDGLAKTGGTYKGTMSNMPVQVVDNGDGTVTVTTPGENGRQYTVPGSVTTRQDTPIIIAPGGKAYASGSTGFASYVLSGQQTSSTSTAGSSTSGQQNSTATTQSPGSSTPGQQNPPQLNNGVLTGGTFSDPKSGWSYTADGHGNVISTPPPGSNANSTSNAGTLVIDSTGQPHFIAAPSTGQAGNSPSGNGQPGAGPSGNGAILSSQQAQLVQIYDQANPGNPYGLTDTQKVQWVQKNGGYVPGGLTPNQMRLPGQ